MGELLKMNSFGVLSTFRLKKKFGFQKSDLEKKIKIGSNLIDSSSEKTISSKKFENHPILNFRQL